MSVQLQSATMRRIFVSLGLLASLLLAGCSTFTELTSDIKDKVMGKEPANPPAELQDFAQSYAAKVDWSSNMGETARYDYTPALEAGYVFDANAKGELSKLDAANGRQAWRVNVGEPISGGVGVGGGMVLVGTSKGNVVAYDFTGKALWKAKVSSEVLSAPRFYDGVVIARAGDNHIFGLDAADGARKWVFERTSPALSLRSSGGLVVDGGAVYAGLPGGKMVAIRADNGKMLWEATVAQPKGVTEIERIADITSLPVVDGPVVYAVAYQGRIAAIDRMNGKVVWNRDISSYSGISVDDGKLYVAHSAGSVYALDYSTSKTYWRQPALLNRNLSTPLPMNGMVAVGDFEGYVHFLNRDDGAFVSRIKVGGDQVMSLVAGNSSSQLIAATRGGGLYAISVASAGTVAEPVVKPAPAKPEQTKSDAVKEQSTSDIEKTIIETTQPAPAETGGANTDSIMFRRDMPETGGADKPAEPEPAK